MLKYEASFKAGMAYEFLSNGQDIKAWRVAPLDWPDIKKGELDMTEYRLGRESAQNILKKGGKD